MEKTARFLVDRSHVLLDWAGINPLPGGKRHNIWTERPRERRRLPTDSEGSKGSEGPPRQNPLGELPEELLLHIMHSLDAPSLLCLRRTSQKFMRLFGDRGFREYHGKRTVGPRQPENARSIESSKELRRFRELLGRDRLCSDCLAARAGPHTKISEYLNWSESPLHCSQCEVDHPSCAFSKKQRNLPSSLRTCIAREGVVQICRHKSLTWLDIETQVLSRAAPQRRGSTLFACETRHEMREVRFAFYGHTCRLALARGLGWRDHTSKIEYDWDEGGKVPPAEKDWCSERDYTWLCAEAEVGRPGPLVPESYWYRQVDPASFNLTDDDESFGVTWCWAGSCPNYWRCHELRRGRRVYIPCEEGCGRASWV